MSKKEALSQFQSRLADRLQLAGHADGRAAAANWLAVEIAGHGFILPLSQSGEIFPWAEPQTIPYAKDWFLGVANLRGALCGVVSLSKYLDMESTYKETEMTKNALSDRRLVGFHPSLDLNTVVVVDKLIGLKNRHQMTMTERKDQYKDELGAEWQEVDLRLLSQNSAFLSIAQ